MREEKRKGRIEREGEIECLQRVLRSNQLHRWQEGEGWKGKIVECGREYAHQHRAPDIPEDIKRRRGRRD